ncbi:hypothetical protein [Streptomyces sasae]|uniref:hypothetical protein n=1 Tax=Streptomyces sasae TaxID=1266772 RepID=UPI00292E8199|nr:hypothetical protein [Streptomyces sasae]
MWPGEQPPTSRQNAPNNPYRHRVTTRSSGGDLVSWSFVGTKGLEGEVPDATVRRILSTVRLYDVPAG